MKQIALISILLVFLVSCVTEKQRSKICQECPARIEIHDSIIETLHDTTIYLTVEGPVQYLENPCANLCDSLGHLKPFEVKKKENGIIGTIRSVGNSIAFDCKADSLEAVIKGLKDRLVFHDQRKDIVKYVPCTNEKTKFDGFTFWFFWIVISILLVRYGWKYLKKYISI